MSIIQNPSHSYHSASFRCERCDTLLPIQATFCGNCGARIEQAQRSPASCDPGEFTKRYRITSLIRRRPFVQLSFALDTQQQRPCIIRDIDITALNGTASAEAHGVLQQEYDLLRRHRIAHLTPLIASYNLPGHLCSIAGWPLSEQEHEDKPGRRLYTLQHLLQSGIGLPDEQIALTWITRLAEAVEQLHQHQIILGDLDPDTIMVPTDTYTGLPALMVSWLPEPLRRLLPSASSSTNTAGFIAPEVLQGQITPRADVYSLAAILYLLLTGNTPTPSSKRITRTIWPRRSVRDFNPRVSYVINSVIMQALSSDPTARFASAAQLAEALQQPESTSPRRSPTTLIRLSKEKTRQEKNLPEIGVRSDMNSKETLTSNDAQQDTDVDETTIRVSAEQARIARYHLSRIGTHHLSQDDPGGEALVADRHNSEQGTEETLLEEPSVPETPSNNIQVAEDHMQQENNIQEAEQIAQAHNDDLLEEELSSQTATQREATEAAVRRILNMPRQEVEPATLLPLPVELETPLPQHVEQQETAPATARSNTDQTEIAEEQTEEDKQALEPLPTETPVPTEGFEEQPTQPVPLDATPESAVAQTMLPETQVQPAETQSRESEPPAPQEVTEKPLEQIKDLLNGTTAKLANFLPAKGTSTAVNVPNVTEKASSLLKQVKRFLLGEQQLQTAAAALIETPMRIQPTQDYIIRIHIMGRDEADQAEQTGGLSALKKGDIVHIEVRSALYQNYAYIVQQANVEIPAGGYAAEVTMHMHPLGNGPSPRRERLQIVFLDEARDPLYEKPFVIELFISHLVHPGREGHNVLSIPL